MTGVQTCALPICGFNSRGRSASDITQFGDTVKNAYVTICNRNPDVAGWIYWMNKLCEQVSTKASSFTSLALHAGGYCNDGAFNDYATHDWQWWADSHGGTGITRKTYRNVSLTPGAYSISIANGNSHFNMAILESYNGPIITYISQYGYKSKVYDNQFTITSSINAILTIETDDPYSTDAGWGWHFKIFKGSKIKFNILDK